MSRRESNADFDEVAQSYKAIVENAVSFGGKPHDFYMQVKAEAIQRIIQTRFPESREVKVLDVGCGVGLIHAYLDDLPLKITGVDPFSETLKVARARNPHVEYREYNEKASLPFEDESFDFVFTVCVMHHVVPEKWDSFVTELKRVTKRGGSFAIFEHNPYNPGTRLVVARTPFDKDAVLITQAKLIRIFRRLKPATIDSKYILFFPFESRIFRRIENLISWLPFGAQYYVEFLKHE